MNFIWRKNKLNYQNNVINKKKLQVTPKIDNMRYKAKSKVSLLCKL